MCVSRVCARVRASVRAQVIIECASSVCKCASSVHVHVCVHICVHVCVCRCVRVHAVRAWVRVRAHVSRLRVRRGVQDTCVHISEVLGGRAACTSSVVAVSTGVCVPPSTAQGCAQA